ncbi:MAG: ABC transporter ATP-binding protein [bacterium]
MIHRNENQQKLLQYSNWQLLKDIGSYLRPYRWRFVIASLLRLTSDVAALYPAYALASVVTFFSKFSSGDSLKKLWIIFILWGVAYLYKDITRHLAKYIGFQASEKAALDAQVESIKHLSLLDISWHEQENAGNKLKRIQKGSAGLDKILRMWLGNFIEIGVNFVGMIFILSRIDKTVGGIMIIFLIIYFILSYGLLGKAGKASQLVDIKEEEISGLMFQIINNVRSIKVLAMAEKILKIAGEYIDDVYKKIKRRIFLFQVRGTILNVTSLFFRLGTLIFIAVGIAYGRYEVGFLVLFSGYFHSLTTSVNELADTTQDVVIYKYGIARMQQMLNEPIIIEDEKDKVEFPENWKKIKVNNLSFSYGQNEVLKNISFEIEKGQRIGVVGLSGAGKSTLMKLLLKEVENYCGEIMIDDIPLKNIKRASYLKHIGVVLQETEVFNFTLADNVTLAGQGKQNKEELKKSLDIAHVSDFAAKLPKGIKTYIGEKGVRLSGGEKQRLGIARAIYKQPKILFLDEATSHLDSESEKKIKDSLHKFFQNITAVVIAHRLTTIQEMDKILVLEQGKIVEEGSYRQLFNKQGRFYELCKKQQL